jgi:large subunit ribosomal protein L3
MVNSIPVTVLDVSNNRVTQIKTVDTDGYTAVQVRSASAAPAASPRRCWSLSPRRVSSRVTSSSEFRVDRRAARRQLKLAVMWSVPIFQVGQKVDVHGRDDR